jgi:hypothetical protein
VLSVIALLVGVPAAIYSIQTPSDDTTLIDVDGDMSDWETASVLDDATMEPGSTPGSDITRYGCANDELNLYLMFGVRGTLFGSDILPEDQRDSAFIFIDTDSDPDTGFSVNALGAERMVHLSGVRGAVTHSDLYEFDTGHRTEGSRSAWDFNGWSPMFSLDSDSDGKAVEVCVPLAALEPGPSHCLITFITDTCQGGGDESDHLVNPTGTAVSIEQVPLVGDLVSPGDHAVLELRVNGLLGTTVIDELGLCGAGCSPDEVTGLPAEVAAGETLTFRVTCSVGGGEPGEPISAGLDPRRVSAGGAAVTVKGEAARFYPDMPGMDHRSQVRADGLLLEWDGVPMTPDTRGDVANTNIDLISHGALQAGGQLAFLCSVEGEALGGTRVASRAAGSSLHHGGDGGGSLDAVELRQEPKDLPPAEGMDVVFAFIDADGDTGTGSPLGDDGTAMGADLLVEVKGRDGRADRVLTYRYAGSSAGWEPIGTGEAAASGAHLEFTTDPSMPLPQIAQDARVAFYARDWRGEEDRGDALSPLTGTPDRTTEAIQDTGLAGEPGPDGDGTSAGESQGGSLVDGLNRDEPLHTPEFGSLIMVPLALFTLLLFFRRPGRRGGCPKEVRP